MPAALNSSPTIAADVIHACFVTRPPSHVSVPHDMIASPRLKTATFTRGHTMPETTRIKDIPENELTPEQAKVFNDLVAGRGRLLTPYRIWIHSPRLAAALETIGTFLNKKSSLSEREVELVICIIANHWKAEYVWTVHTRMCVELGIPQRVFDAIRAGQAPG